MKREIQKLAVPAAMALVMAAALLILGEPTFDRATVEAVRPTPTTHEQHILPDSRELTTNRPAAKRQFTL